MCALRFLFCSAIGAALAGCSSIAPIVIDGPRGFRQEGTAWTSLYGGRFTAGICSGSYNGTLETEDVAIALQCTDGRRGAGVGRRQAGNFLAGVVRLTDGSELLIRRTADQVTYFVTPGGPEILTRGWQPPTPEAVTPPWMRRLVGDTPAPPPQNGNGPSPK